MLITSTFLNSSVNVSAALMTKCHRCSSTSITPVQVGKFTSKAVSTSICTRTYYTFYDNCNSCNYKTSTYDITDSTTSHKGAGMRFKSCNGSYLYYSNDCSVCFMSLASKTEICSRHPVHPE